METRIGYLYGRLGRRIPIILQVNREVQARILAAQHRFFCSKNYGQSQPHILYPDGRNHALTGLDLELVEVLPLR
jgi:hypothetical protein